MELTPYSSLWWVPEIQPSFEEEAKRNLLNRFRYNFTKGFIVYSFKPVPPDCYIMDGVGL